MPGDAEQRRAEIRSFVEHELRRGTPATEVRRRAAALFRAKGVPQSTVYRVLGSMLGAPPALPAPVVAAPAEDRLEPVAAEPDVVPPGAAVGPAHMAQRLMRTLLSAEECMDLARGDDGKVRAPKLMLAAADSVRRAIATVVDLQEALNSAQRHDEFNRDFIAALKRVARDHPDLAEVVARELLSVTERWGSG